MEELFGRLVQRAFGVIIAVLVLFHPHAANAQTEEEGAEAICGTQPITIAQMQWPSSQLLAHIHAAVLSEGFGCITQVVSGDMSASLSSMATTGQPGMIPELWLTRVAATWNATLESRRVRAMAPSFSGGAFESWFLPTYALANNPELTNTESLREAALAARQAGEPIKFISCPQDWACALINENLLRALDLNDVVDRVEPANRFEFDTLISQSISAQDLFVFYYWQPNSLLSQFDVRPVSLPIFDKDAFACLASRSCLNPEPSGFAPENVSIAVTDWVLSIDDRLSAYFLRASMPFETVNELMTWQAESGESVEATAAHFVQTYPDIWQAWVGQGAGT